MSEPARSGGEVRAPLIEVFASVQGEGRHVGVPMAFVRVAVCPIRCAYCDTPDSYRAPKTFVVASTGGTEPNPVAASRAVDLAGEAVAASRYGTTEWVSLTGGEPLLYPLFVAAVGVGLRARGLRVFLETAALDSAALARCIDAVDHLSLDYKLPGTLLPSPAGLDDAQVAEQCVASVELAAARRVAGDGGAGPSVDVKMVLTAESAEDGYRAALRRLQPHAAAFRLFLQPVTPFGAVDYPCPPERVARFAALAGAAGFAARVLPQVHKLLGID